MPSEDAKPVKKEEVEDDDNDNDNDNDDEKPIAQVRKNYKKPTTPSTAKSKVKKEEFDESDSPLKKPAKSTSKPAKPKKEEADFDDCKKPVAKNDKKKVKKKKEEEKGKGDGKKRERKVYDLPGQKRDPPEERDPLRIFYETLYEQKPGSELAEVWMMESGLLPLEKAKRVFEKKMISKNRKLTSPAKPVRETTKSVTVKKKVEPLTPKSSMKKKTTESVTVLKQSKKRKAESSEEDESSGDEFIVSTKKVTKRVKTN